MEKQIMLDLERNLYWRRLGRRALELPWLLDARHCATWVGYCRSIKVIK